MDFSDYIFLILILLMSISLICAGILQVQGNAQISIIHTLIKLFWYPDEYYIRRNNHTRISKIKHYLGILIIVMATFFMGVVFFYWNQSILFEIILKISILMNTIMYARKYLM